MGFIRLAVTNLRRHSTRTVLTVSGIAAASAVLFSILSFHEGFGRGVLREIERTGIHFMVVPSGCAHEVASLVLHGAVIPKFLDTAVMGKLKEEDGIEIASPIVVAQMPNPQKDRIDLIYGIEMGMLSAIKPSWKLSGSVPATEDEIIMGSEVALHHGAATGSAVSYLSGSARFRVSAILEKTGSQDDAFIYMPVTTAQKLLGKPSGATAIAVKVKDPAHLQKTIDRLSAEVPGIQIVTMNQVMSSITNLAASAKVLSLSLACIALFISAVGVMNSILTAVFERTREIGMMRAIGASRSDIVRVVLSETVFMTTSGALAGIAISAAGSRTTEAVIRKFMPYVPGGTLIHFDAAIAAGTIVFVAGIGMAAGLYPAWKASRISPMEAIRR